MKTYLGIIVRQHHTVQWPMGTELKKGQYAVLLQSGLEGKWWADSEECYCYLRNVHDLLSDEKTPYDWRFSEPSRGPIIPFGSMVEYHPISTQDRSRLHQFGKRFFTWNIRRIPLVRGGIWKWLWSLRSWKGRTHQKSTQKQLNAKEVMTSKIGEKSYFSPQMESKIIWRRSGPKNVHLITGSPWTRRRTWKSSRRIRRVSTTTSRLTSGCRWSTKWFLVHFGRLHLLPSRWTASQTLLAERRTIPNSTEIYWRDQNYSYEFGCQAREAHWWLLEHWWLSRLVWSLHRFHTIYSTRRKSSWRIYVVRGGD